MGMGKLLVRLLLSACCWSGDHNPHAHVDALEINHVHTPQGDYQFSQTIVWRATVRDREPIAWVIVKDHATTPRRTGELWTVRIQGTTYRAKVFLQTFTPYDRELKARRNQ